MVSSTQECNTTRYLTFMAWFIVIGDVNCYVIDLCSVMGTTYTGSKLYIKM